LVWFESVDEDLTIRASRRSGICEVQRRIFANALTFGQVPTAVAWFASLSDDPQRVPAEAWRLCGFLKTGRRFVDRYFASGANALA
jgi:hypothetical protein